jgi:ABC-type multidrug transport system fused ATPase/permease subunit
MESFSETPEKAKAKATVECYNDMTLLKLVTGFIQQEKSLFIVYGLLLLALPLKDVVFPRLIGNLYGSIKGESGSGGKGTGKGKGKEIQNIVTGIVAVIIIIQVLNIVSDQIDIQLHPSIYKFIREKIMDHLFRIKETNYSDVEIGGIISKIIKLPSIIHFHLESIRIHIIPYIVTTLCILAYIFYLDLMLALPLVLVLCIFVATLYYSMNVCSPTAYKRDEMFSLMMSNTDDILRNMITIMSFNKNEDEKEKMNETHKLYATHTRDTLSCTLYSKYINIPCILGYVLFVCYYSYNKMKAKKMPSATLVTLLIMVFIVMNILFSTMDKWKDIIMRNGIIENSLKSFEECHTKREPYTKPAANKDTIRFQDIGFSYVANDTQRPVFNDFTLDIITKETTLIVGEIGSGKSTIISLLLKYQTPQRGEIFLEGVPYSTIPTTELRQRIIYIPQTPILLNRTVYDNIVYGVSTNPSKKEVEALIHETKLSRFLDKLPKGLDTSVGVHGNSLSGGQRQIVWILKAILMNPEIIIMDEPTSAVDDETKSIIHYLLEKIVSGKTVIMITHDPYLLKFANRIVTLREGEITKDERSAK